MTKRLNKYQRIAAGLLLLFSALFLPWWITILLGISFAFLFPRYIELFTVGFMIDLLYGIPVSWYFDTLFVVGTSSFAAYFLIEYLKTKLLIYA